jgi:hypothetical protein
VATPGQGADDQLVILQEVLAVLSRLGIAHAQGASWASSLLGKMRFTHDADVCVEPFPGKERNLCAAFGDDYYVSLPAVQQAVRARQSFNVLHTPHRVQGRSLRQQGEAVRSVRPVAPSGVPDRRPRPNHHPNRHARGRHSAEARMVSPRGTSFC